MGRPRREKAWRRALGPVVVSVMLGAAGCSSAGDTAPPPTSTAEQVTTTLDAAVARGPEANRAMDGYRRFWAALMAAADPMDPDSALLAQHATGAQLSQLRTGLKDHRDLGEVFRGSVDLAPEVVGLEAAAATVEDCLTSRLLRHDAKTGASRGQALAPRLEITAGMVLEEGTWKVQTLAYGMATCAVSERSTSFKGVSGREPTAS